MSAGEESLVIVEDVWFVSRCGLPSVHSGIRYKCAGGKRHASRPAMNKRPVKHPPSERNSPQQASPIVRPTNNKKEKKQAYMKPKKNTMERSRSSASKSKSWGKSVGSRSIGSSKSSSLSKGTSKSPRVKEERSRPSEMSSATVSESLDNNSLLLRTKSETTTRQPESVLISKMKTLPDIARTLVEITLENWKDAIKLNLGLAFNEHLVITGIRDTETDLDTSELLVGDQVVQLNDFRMKCVTRFKPQQFTHVLKKCRKSGKTLTMLISRRVFASPVPESRADKLKLQLRPGFGYCVLTCQRPKEEMPKKDAEKSTQASPSVPLTPADRAPQTPTKGEKEVAPVPHPSFGLTLKPGNSRVYVCNVDPAGAAHRFFRVGDIVLDVDGEKFPEVPDLKCMHIFANKYFTKGVFSCVIERAVSDEAVSNMIALFNSFLTVKNDYRLNTAATKIGCDAAAMHAAVFSKINPKSVLRTQGKYAPPAIKTAGDGLFWKPPAVTKRLIEGRRGKVTEKDCEIRLSVRPQEYRIGSDVREGHKLENVKRKERKKEEPTSSSFFGLF